MPSHAIHTGNGNTLPRARQLVGQLLTSLGHSVALLFAPAAPRARELRDSLSHPDTSAAPRVTRPARPHSVDRADARALSAYCQCINHTPALHRCGLTATATIEQCGRLYRACEYHARRADSFGLLVLRDDA